MALPLYLTLTDDNNQIIKGSSSVIGRENTIEVIEFDHDVEIPTDKNTGKLVGARIHKPLSFCKEIDSSSVYLYKAVTTGQTLKTAEFKWYRINESGQEVEYFTTKLENVKVVSVEQIVPNVKNSQNDDYPHLEKIKLRYEKISWVFKDGNIIHNDSWNNR